MKNSLAVYRLGLHDRDYVPVALENCACRGLVIVFDFIHWWCARYRDYGASL